MVKLPWHVGGVMPKNPAAVDVGRPFSLLPSFSVSFLNRFEVSELTSLLLDNISFTSMPGILCHEKQRVERR